MKSFIGLFICRKDQYIAVQCKIIMSFSTHSLSTSQCLYDGFDCESVESCHPNYEAYCKKHWNNNNCDQGCNSMACGWDGFDCEAGPPQYAGGYLVVVVMTPPEVFANNTAAFLRELGKMLHVVVAIAKDQKGNDMIYPYTSNEVKLGSNLRIKRFLQQVGRLHRYLMRIAIVADLSPSESLLPFGVEYDIFENAGCCCCLVSLLLY